MNQKGERLMTRKRSKKEREKARGNLRRQHPVEKEKVRRRMKESE